MSREPIEPFIVALCQYEFGGVGDVEALTERASELLADAGPADLYVLPELFGADVDSWFDEEIGEPVFDEHAAAAVADWVGATAVERDALVVGGSYNVREDGHVYNRAPIGLPDGTVEFYDKCHLIPEERAGGKRAGEGDLPVVEHRGVLVGLAVCYDVEFPGAIRRLAEAGAEVIAVPSWTATEAGFQRVRRCAAARAVENQAYVAACNRVGVDGNDIEYSGDSMIIDPMGYPLATGAMTETIVMADVDPAEVARTRERFPFMADRRS